MEALIHVFIKETSCIFLCMPSIYFFHKCIHIAQGAYLFYIALKIRLIMKNNIIFYLVLAIISSKTYADECEWGDFSTPIKGEELVHTIIEPLIKKPAGLISISGDLDGDSIDDVVVCALNDDKPGILLVILHGEEDGKLTPWSRSKFIDPEGVHGPTISIDEQSLFISMYSDTTGSYFKTTDQFKYRNGKFVLIGNEFDSFEKDEEFISSGRSRTQQHISTNFVTRKTISRSEGKESVDFLKKNNDKEFINLR